MEVIDNEPTQVQVNSLRDIPRALNRVDTAEIRVTPLPSEAPRVSLCALSELIRVTWLRELANQTETALDAGKWHEAVELAQRGVRKLSGIVAGTHAEGERQGWSMAALLLGLSAHRYLQFQQLVQRSAHTGAVSREDALFALFCLIDAGLRWQEETPTGPVPD
jgi:hypothetical protein